MNERSSELRTFRAGTIYAQILKSSLSAVDVPSYSKKNLQRTYKIRKLIQRLLCLCIKRLELYAVAKSLLSLSTSSSDCVVYCRFDIDVFHSFSNFCSIKMHPANLHSCKRLIRCHPWLDMTFERKCRSIDQQQARNRNRVDMTRRTLEPHMMPCGNLSLNRWHQRDMCSWCKHPDAKHHLAVKCFTWLLLF